MNWEFANDYLTQSFILIKLTICIINDSIIKERILKNLIKKIYLTYYYYFIFFIKFSFTL